MLKKKYYGDYQVPSTVLGNRDTAWKIQCPASSRILEGETDSNRKWCRRAKPHGVRLPDIYMLQTFFPTQVVCTPSLDLPVSMCRGRLFYTLSRSLQRVTRGEKIRIGSGQSVMSYEGARGLFKRDLWHTMALKLLLIATWKKEDSFYPRLEADLMEGFVVSSSFSDRTGCFSILWATGHWNFQAVVEG